MSEIVFFVSINCIFLVSYRNLYIIKKSDTFIYANYVCICYLYKTVCVSFLTFEQLTADSLYAMYVFNAKGKHNISKKLFTLTRYSIVESRKYINTFIQE